MSKKAKREPRKIRRYWIPKKWKTPMIVALILMAIYFLFLAASSLFNGTASDTYIEVFVGDWMKGSNDSRTLPIVFDVVPTAPAIQDIVLPNENIISLGHGIGASKYIAHCGLSDPCSSGEFSVHIYTGKDHNDHPMLCVDGKYVIGEGRSVGGRGINVAVIDILTKSVIQIRNFDTYVQESTQLETLLLTLRPGDIIIMLTFDEPTKKLSRVARLLFHDLGSSKAQNLQYRAGWYLVTQKGINGFSPYEGLNLVDSDGWPAAHDQRFCVPINLLGQKVHPDPLPRLNPQRNAFCRRHPVFPNFCDGDVVNDGLQPAAALKSGIAGTLIFTLPVIVMSGTAINLKYLPMTLETIVRQPGINPKYVVVYYLPQHPEVAELAELFGFMSEELTCKGTPCAHALEAFQTTNLLFPDADAVIYIEENVILSPDFISYFGQFLPFFKMDSSIDAISAFNENGFVGNSGDPTIMHRAETSSGLALLIRKNAIGKELCKNRTRQEWLVKGLGIAQDVLIPDLSRIVYIPSNVNSELLTFFKEAATKRERETSLLSEVRIPNIHLLVKDEYDKSILKDLSKSQKFRLELETLEKCLSLNVLREPTKGLSLLAPDFVLANFSRQVLVFEIEQERPNDFTKWRKLTSCLGLFSHPALLPRNIYKGLLRFTWSNNKVYLVSSLSRFSPFHQQQQQQQQEQQEHNNLRNDSNVFLGQLLPTSS